MNTQKYPTWLVPLDIAQELKEIGFNEYCCFYWDNHLNLVDCYNDENGYPDLEGYNSNKHQIKCSLPTWTEVLAWFRERGYKITFKDINIGTQCAFYHLDIKEGHTFSHFAKKYEKAREGLVMKLIEVHKEFGNNIKRFD